MPQSAARLRVQESSACCRALSICRTPFTSEPSGWIILSPKSVNQYRLIRIATGSDISDAPQSLPTVSQNRLRDRTKITRHDAKLFLSRPLLKPGWRQRIGIVDRRLIDPEKNSSTTAMLIPFGKIWFKYIILKKKYIHWVSATEYNVPKIGRSCPKMGNVSACYSAQNC